MKNQIPKKCDVLVIGGGPAGSMAASSLAREGVDVVVIEKQQFPRDTVGESLIPHVWKYLDLIEVSEEVEQAGFIKKKGGIVYWDGAYRKMSFKDLGYTRQGLHVERDIFDQILLNKAESFGAKVFMPVKVIKAQLGDNTSQVVYKDQISGVTGEIIAKYIIDSSGQSAVISRQEKIRCYDDAFRFNAFWGYYSGGHYVDNQMQVHPFGEQKKHSPLTLVSTIGDWGWVWQIVLQEKVSVGLILPKENLPLFKNKGDSMEERFDNFLRETPLIGKVMKDAQLIADSVKSLKDYAYTPSNLTPANCYLAGDAAAFVDPINSSGVVMALYSGFFSAWCIHKSLKKEHRKTFYQELYRKQLTTRLDLFKLIAYPAHLHTPEMLEKGVKIFSQLGDEEMHLALTQTTLINRAENLKKLLNLPEKKYYSEWNETEINNLLFAESSC